MYRWKDIRESSMIFQRDRDPAQYVQLGRYAQSTFDASWERFGARNARNIRDKYTGNISVRFGGF